MKLSQKGFTNVFSYFNFGDDYGADLDYLQTTNAFIGGGSPASSVYFNYVVYRDGIITSKRAKKFSRSIFIL